MGRWSRCTTAVAMELIIATGAAAAGLEGRSGPLAWRATDVQQNITTVDGKRHARHEFGLTLKNVSADSISLNAYEALVSYFGVHTSEIGAPLRTNLASGLEFRLSLSTLLPCPAEPRTCRFSEGPSWRVVVAGRAAGHEFTTPIELTLPADASSPVVLRERVLVTRAASSADPTLIPSSFKANLVLVRASINGHDLTLLFDTGAQVCVLSPEAAKRVGVTAPPDGPVMPLIGFFGVPGDAPLVRLPTVRVGDYVVEHLTGSISSVAHFPIAIDGVLGANFIEAFRVTVDHRARQLRLDPR
jgi:hypothetical protein